MPTSLLPAFGWSAHSEQVDAASLEARAWRMATEMFGGKVLTQILAPPDAGMVAQLEKIAAHMAQCTDPRCHIGLGVFRPLEMCPNGKYDPSVCLFLTTVTDALGQLVQELMQSATDPGTAERNHYGACALIAGSLGSWKNFDTKAGPPV